MGMTRDKALIRARGLWSDAGCTTRLIAEKFRGECRFCRVAEVGGGSWITVEAFGATWDIPLERLERRLRGTVINLLPEEAAALLDVCTATVPERLKDRLRQIAGKP